MWLLCVLVLVCSGWRPQACHRFLAADSKGFILTQRSLLSSWWVFQMPEGSKLCSLTWTKPVKLYFPRCVNMWCWASPRSSCWTSGDRQNVPSVLFRVCVCVDLLKKFKTTNLDVLFVSMTMTGLRLMSHFPSSHCSVKFYSSQTTPNRILAPC